MKVNRDTAVPLIGTWKFPPIPQAEPTFGKRLAGHARSGADRIAPAVPAPAS